MRLGVGAARSWLFLSLPTGLGSCSFFGCGCSAVWSLRPWAFPVTHRVSDFLSIGSPVVPQARTLVFARTGNLFVPGEEN